MYDKLHRLFVDTYNSDQEGIDDFNSMYEKIHKQFVMQDIKDDKNVIQAVQNALQEKLELVGIEIEICFSQIEIILFLYNVRIKILSKF